MVVAVIIVLLMTSETKQIGKDNYGIMITMTIKMILMVIDITPG